MWQQARVLWVENANLKPLINQMIYVEGEPESTQGCVVRTLQEDGTWREDTTDETSMFKTNLTDDRRMPLYIGQGQVELYPEGMENPARVDYRKFVTQK